MLEHVRTFVNLSKVPKGTCTRCAGNKYLKQQCYGGDVAYVECSRCEGTGKEPVGFLNKFKAAFRIEDIRV